MVSEAGKAFGQRLRQARQKAGLSQSELAEAAGLSVRTLQSWEQGQREPLADQVRKLVEALKADANELLGCYEGWDEAPKRPRKKEKGA